MSWDLSNERWERAGKLHIETSAKDLSWECLGHVHRMKTKSNVSGSNERDRQMMMSKGMLGPYNDREGVIQNAMVKCLDLMLEAVENH